MVTDNIISFLQNRGWAISNRNLTFSELTPPENFHLPESYRINIPIHIDKVDSEKFIYNLLGVIGEFYSLNTEDLNVLLQKENSIFKVRVHDEDTEDGKISLNRFEELIERIRAILSDTASFVIDRSVTSKRVPVEVSRYLNLCNFMQTEKGSFVAKIQLPSKELIKEKELFDRDEVFSKEINNKLSEILEYVNQDIFEGDVQVSEDYLIQNENRINIKLFKNIGNLYEKAQIKNVDFTFHNIENSMSVVNENITKHKLHKLNEFIEKVESFSYELDNFTFSGQIISLKSKDPDGLKNSVTYVGIYEELEITVSANLDSEQYKQAIEAHKLKQNISISGLANKTKSKAKFIEITSFIVED